MPPLCSFTILYIIASPRPVPLSLVVKNGSNKCCIFSSGIPTPLSETATIKYFLLLGSYIEGGAKEKKMVPERNNDILLNSDKPLLILVLTLIRSEERRVGKEC